MKNVFLSSMKVKLITMFLAISLVPLIIAGAVSYISAKTALEKEFIESFKAISQGREEAVIRYLRTKTKVTASFATDIFIRNTLEKIDQHGPDMAALVNSLNEYLSEDKSRIDPDTEMTSIINPEGKIIASTDKSIIGEDKSKDQYFIEGKSGVYIKDPYISSTGKECIAVSMPMKSKATGAFIGVVVNRYETKELNEILSDMTGMGDTGETYMLDGNDHMVTDSRFAKNVFLQQKVDTPIIKIFRFEKRENAGTYKDYRGARVLGAVSGADLDKEFGLGWAIIAEIDANEAFSAANKLRNIMILIVLIIGAIVSMSALAISETVVRPVVNLADAASKVAGGDLSGPYQLRVTMK